MAVGDVHGAYDVFAGILRTAGVIDRRDRWIAGATHLVQTGDVLDRGAKSRQVMDLLRRLEQEAPRAGGRVHALVGNHEAMRLTGDLRDVSPGEIAAFRTGRSGDVRQIVLARWLQARREEGKRTGQIVNEAKLSSEFEAQTPLGLLEMLSAFSPEGEYGKWIRGHVAMVRINGILFVHGGVSARVAPLGCQAINTRIRDELTARLDVMRQEPLASLSGSTDGPLWYRGLATEDEAALAPELDRILETIGARAIVIGHTIAPTGRITPRFGGRVVQIDTGMLAEFFTGGRASALEIAGEKWTAIYEDGHRPVR